MSWRCIHGEINDLASRFVTLSVCLIQRGLQSITLHSTSAIAFPRKYGNFIWQPVTKPNRCTQTNISSPIEVEQLKQAKGWSNSGACCDVTMRQRCRGRAQPSFHLQQSESLPKSVLIRRCGWVGGIDSIVVDYFRNNFIPENWLERRLNKNGPSYRLKCAHLSCKSHSAQWNMYNCPYRFFVLLRWIASN